MHTVGWQVNLVCGEVFFVSLDCQCVPVGPSPGQAECETASELLSYPLPLSLPFLREGLERVWSLQLLWLSPSLLSPPSP